jgi:MFS transporter, NNP family, nitrate/nitrite transporter
MAAVGGSNARPGTSLRAQQWSVVVMSTLAFTVCFAIWMMFAVIGIPIKKMLDLNATQFGLLTATPVLTGSLIRVPLGMWTDKYGGRIVFFLLMIATVVPIWLIGYATEYWHFLVLGLFVGLAGGSFSVGTPYVARWFEKKNQGFAMGIFGAGNSGAAVTKFVAPALVVGFGWALVPQVYAVAMLVTAIAFWFFTYSDPKHLVPGNVTYRRQLEVLRDPAVWKYCQYYSIVFGGYVALSLWMVQYYVGEFGLDIRIAALLAACFSLPGGVLRAIGGWMSDKWGAHKVTWWVMWVSWICLFLLSYPTTSYTITTINGPYTFTLAHNVWTFTLLMGVLGMAWAFGKASVFKYIADDYPTNIGTISGIVGLAGGLGGFILPDDVRRAARPHRRALERLHADVRRGLGVADLDVPHRGQHARRRRPRAEACRLIRDDYKRGTHDVSQRVRRRSAAHQPGRHRRLAPRGRRVLGVHGQEGRQPQPVDQRPEPAVRLRGLADVGNHHGADGEPRVPVLAGGTVHAGGDLRAVGRHAAHPGFVLHPHRGRPQHDLPDDRAADDPGARHRHRAQRQEHAAVGVPAHGAAVGHRRRQLRLLDVEHQHVLPEAAAGHGARHQRRARQLRRDHDADPDPAGDDRGGVHVPRRRPDDAGEALGHADRQDPGRHADLHPERRLHLARAAGAAGLRSAGSA